MMRIQPKKPAEFCPNRRKICLYSFLTPLNFLWFREESHGGKASQRIEDLDAAPVWERCQSFMISGASGVLPVLLPPGRVV